VTLARPRLDVETLIEIPPPDSKSPEEASPAQKSGDGA
jgi:hypothetical protein